MVAAVPEETVHTIHIVKERRIAAPVDLVFEAVLAELGPEAEMPGMGPVNMVFEPWPGGRWYRDLGDNNGHLWGHVQVIKPPTLLEICGPLFMSYPAISHVQYRLVTEGEQTVLKVTHRAMGLITAEHREGVQTGWNNGLDKIVKIAERLVSERK
ncbi:MAG: SRPBCC domain-containing protein [Planctomycetaceae bacterium]|nr:SRPBCC domain-containing protein [Planctomycetaceae bacterium]